MRRSRRGTSRPPAAATRRRRPRPAATATPRRSPAPRSGSRGCYPYGLVDDESVQLLSQALERLPEADGALRARVTGLLAVFEPDQRRREALIDDALAMARRLGDEATTSWLHPSAVIVNWQPARAAQRADAAEEIVRSAMHHADHGALLNAYLIRIRDALQDGNVARADADLDRARPVVHGTRRSIYRWHMLVAEAGRAAFAGRLDEAEKLNEEALAINRRHGEDCWQEYTVGTLVLARQRWRPHDADAAQLRGFAARYPHLPVWEAMLASLEWELGDVEAARRGVARCARDDFAAVAALARLPARRRLPGRGRRRRGRAGGGHDAVRAAGAVRGHEPGARAAVGRLRARRARARAAGRGRRPPRRRGGALRRGDGGWRRPGARRAGSCGRSGTGWRPAFPSPIAASSSTAGSSLARELGLPDVAARIADEAQIITP